MITFLFGTDHYRLRLREHSLVNDFCTSHAGAEEQVFDGRDATDGLLPSLQEGLSGGLFFVPRVIRIRHAELFEEKICRAIIQQLSLPIPEEVLVIASAELTGRAKKGNPLQLWFAKNAEAEEVNVLTGRALTQSILELLRSIDTKARMVPRAVELLGLRTGGATGRISHDLLKLVLASEGEVITETNVLQLTEEPVGESVSFTLLDALVRGNRESAIGLLRREETNEDAMFKLLGLFAWQVRQALMVRDEYDRGNTSPDAIAVAIGAKPFSVKKLLPLIPRLSLERLKRSLAYLSDIDHGIKTGQIRPGVALDLFVWKF